MHITQQFVLSKMRPTVDAFTKEKMSELCCRMSKILSYSNSSAMPVFSSVRQIRLLSKIFIIFSSRSNAFSRSAIFTLDSFCTSFFFITVDGWPGLNSKVGLWSETAAGS